MEINDQRQLKIMNPFRRIRENTPSATNPKPQTTLLFLFAAFMFAQFVILRMGNRAGSGFLPEPQQELVYFFLQIIVIGGFLAHALAYNFLQACRSYRLSRRLFQPGIYQYEDCNTVSGSVIKRQGWDSMLEAGHILF